MGPAIEFSRVSKHFFTSWRQLPHRVLDGLSLQINAGEVVAVMGPNGSGKSTALKIAAGLLVPSGGSCHVLGDAATSAAARACIGYMPESPSFPDHLTGEEVVCYYAGLSGLKPTLARAAARQALAQVGLHGAESRPVRHYTKGMRQRLGLAQALAHEPPVLLLDEPTAGVDPQGVADMLALINRLKIAGRTVLISSHLLDEVGEICDRIVILAEGRPVFCGQVPLHDAKHDARECFTTESMSTSTRKALADWLKERGHTLHRDASQRPRLTQVYLAQVNARTTATTQRNP
jgi:ABC-2 type transport system ATP-binding protein